MTELATGYFVPDKSEANALWNLARIRQSDFERIHDDECDPLHVYTWHPSESGQITMKTIRSLLQGNRTQAAVWLTFKRFCEEAIRRHESTFPVTPVFAKELSVRRVWERAHRYETTGCPSQARDLYIEALERLAPARRPLDDVEDAIALIEAIQRCDMMTPSHDAHVQK